RRADRRAGRRHAVASARPTRARGARVRAGGRALPEARPHGPRRARGAAVVGGRTAARAPRRLGGDGRTVARDAARGVRLGVRRRVGSGRVGGLKGYAELHARSAFSMLDGASTPEDLARHAADLGIETLALT